MDTSELSKLVKGQPFAEPDPTFVRAFGAGDFPVEVTHDVDGYRLDLVRSGGAAAFYGWVELLKGSTPVGFIYLQPEPQEPRLGSTNYIVFGVEPTFLPMLLERLGSGRPIQIRFFKGSANLPATAFLHA